MTFDETARANQNLDFTVDETVESDMYATASTIADLAGKIGVPAAALGDSVTRYNELVVGGTDLDFGKSEMAAEIKTAPFHAVKWGIQEHNTLGGVTVNEKAQVKDGPHRSSLACMRPASPRAAWISSAFPSRSCSGGWPASGPPRRRQRRRRPRSLTLKADHAVTQARQVRTAQGRSEG